LGESSKPFPPSFPVKSVRRIAQRAAEPHLRAETHISINAQAGRCIPAQRSSRSGPRALLVGGQFGRRERLETLVRNRLTTLDRKTVRAGGETFFGALDRGELLAEILLQALVELVLVEIGGQIRRVILVCRLAVVLTSAPSERPLDPFALGSKKLACPVGVHHATLAQHGHFRRARHYCTQSWSISIPKPAGLYW
jgi:hypothetical protein